LNSAYNIITSGADTTQCVLLVEISCHSLSYMALNSNNECIALVVFNFTTNNNCDSITNYIKDIVAEQPFLQRSFKKITIVYAFEKVLLVPHKFMSANTNKDMLELVFGDSSDSVIKIDFLDKHNLYIIYLVNTEVDLMVTQLFGYGKKVHLYSLLPNIKEVDNANLLYCIVGIKQITVQLFKLGNLQIVQNFNYTVPEDVAFSLLNICERFEMNLADTLLYLNGMIEENSNLYVELHNYFPLSKFGSLPETFIYNARIKQYPAHYFNHLFQLAACV